MKYPNEHDIETSASMMYDGGWRSTDKEEWIAEYCNPSNDDPADPEDWERYEPYFKKWENAERNKVFEGIDALYIPYNEGWDENGKAMWRVLEVKDFGKIRLLHPCDDEFSSVVQYKDKSKGIDSLYNGDHICYSAEDAWAWIKDWRNFNRPIFPAEKIPKFFERV